MKGIFEFIEKYFFIISCLRFCAFWIFHNPLFFRDNPERIKPLFHSLACKFDETFFDAPQTEKAVFIVLSDAAVFLFSCFKKCTLFFRKKTAGQITFYLHMLLDVHTDFLSGKCTYHNILRMGQIKRVYWWGDTALWGNAYTVCRR